MLSEYHWSETDMPCLFVAPILYDLIEKLAGSP